MLSVVQVCDDVQVITCVHTTPGPVIVFRLRGTTQLLIYSKFRFYKCLFYTVNVNCDLYGAYDRKLQLIHTSLIFDNEGAFMWLGHYIWITGSKFHHSEQFLGFAGTVKVLNACMLVPTHVLLSCTLYSV